MKRQFISLENYDANIKKINITALPDILQEGHYFLLDARSFYSTDKMIKETIDIYLNRLNDHMGQSEQGITPNISNTEFDFIKRFLEMHRNTITKAELRAYIFDLQKAITTKSISKHSPAAADIELIQKKLITQHNEMILQDQVKIVINRKWQTELRKIANQNSIEDLSGIDPLVSKEAKKDNFFTSFDQQPTVSTTPTFRLPGAMGELLGDLEKFELAITVEGDQGSGKTRFTYQLADAFAEIGNNVAIFTLEIGGKSDLITRMKNEYLQPQNRDRIFRADQLPDGYQTISNATSGFDVIIIDSWNKTGLPSQDFDHLRKQYPDTIFIVIFQRTTQKTIRGGTAPLYDAGINIEVIKVDDSFRNNYAVTTKNRYGITGIKYNIVTKEIIGAAEINPELEEEHQIETV